MTLLAPLQVTLSALWVLSASGDPSTIDSPSPRERRRAHAARGWRGPWLRALMRLGALASPKVDAGLEERVRAAGGLAGLEPDEWAQLEGGCFLGSLGLCAALALLVSSSELSPPWFIAALAPLLVGDLPKRVQRFFIKERRACLEARLPDLADRMANALLAGLTPADALIQAVQTESRSALTPHWLIAELRLSAALLRLSDHGLEQALAHLQHRIPSDALGLLLVQLATASKTGGTPRDALRAFARRRREEVSAARLGSLSTLQGRLSMILSMPVLTSIGVAVHYLGTVVMPSAGM